MIGKTVRFVDMHGKTFDALVTAVHGTVENPSVNVVYVSDDKAKTDPYGRQVERSTSVVHRANQYANGMYWERRDEKELMPDVPRVEMPAQPG